jgi:hypothetical protein
MRAIELRLPHDVLQRATLQGNEYAWPVEYIPKVIEAAREAELASIGGQLQFRLPEEPANAIGLRSIPTSRCQRRYHCRSE